MGQCDDPNCKGYTEFDETAQAIVCTNCGKVNSQTILRDDWDGEVAGSSFYFGPTTLKSLRRVGANLSGRYDKEERDMKNMRAMHQYIGTILARLACSGLTERACALFTQTRMRQPFRWGKKAVLVAGVCIAIVLRENQKGVLLKDLSNMLDIPSPSLFRNIARVSDILNIQLPPLDPLALLARIQRYILELIDTPDTPLPKSLRTFIGNVSSIQTIRLASTLIALISQVEELPLGSSPLSMTCAVYLIALEGQSADCIPSHPLLAKELASRVGVRKELIITHYNAILNVITSWMADVPWLSSSRDPDNLRSKRRKTSHRHVVALGIKEVVRFRVETLKTKEDRKLSDAPVICLEVAEHEEPSNEEPFVETGQRRKRVEQFPERLRSMELVRTTLKRTPLSQLDMASLSLLSPYHPLAPETTTVKRSKSSINDQNGLAKAIISSSILPEDKHYSRLQLLVNGRGGEAFIKDDELFDEKEFDENFRSEEELIKFRTVFGWDDDSTSDPKTLSEFVSTLDWSPMDLEVWAGLGESGDKPGAAEEKTNEVEDRIPDEQIIGEWREASPSGELQLDEDEDSSF